ncbi:TonB-dependent receptor [Sphingomonas sp. ID1715]|uniref:TonB-dependent receptor n=1 Tax=Sphingomonas sp. ID1715 TaxID=1656898 RepID=UPI00148839C5|nr:TonB-dependent receptor [Sphingomonas sp. ID1715]NNM77199.1 TonB-dependent receptor [Sphingomonas sp. ID1715]
MRKTGWLLSAALISIATPGFAQDTQSATSVTESASAPGEETTNSGDIIVTATRRAEALSDVPIAVSAVTAESLQNSGANDIRQLNQLAPSLLVSSTGSEANGSARIRGIGTVGDNPGLESSVAVFIDGVYRSRSGIGLNELGEIDRVEVLRGPQGTLFGRNASAGLIHIISKKPSFEFGGMGEISYGNYDFIRAQGAVTGPLTEQLAARLEGVYVKRDGFYRDPANNTRVNDRDRYFVRGQLLFEPSDDLSFRLIGDYTKRDEKCCAAVYLGNDVVNTIGNLNTPVTPGTGGPLPAVGNNNNIVDVLNDLGQPLSRFQNAYSRVISVSPGRSFAGDTKDWGVSLEANWNLGPATLTSITGYRDYKSGQASDTDYSSVDILYRAPGVTGRAFRTFSQELRLQGSAFDDKLDWLVGAFYADEDLHVNDNLRFGNQYGRFATCRIVSGGALSALYSPTSPGCLAARPAAFGAASPAVYAAFDRLDSINDRGSTLDRYFQNSRNYAFFTHNIFHLTSNLDLTVGLRYTNERKRFRATFGNDNTACVANQQALVPFLTNPALAAVAGGLIGLSCQGNSTSELNGVTIRDRRSEDEWTGTGVLSYKPNDDLLFYASYSRGYKAGGFNLDRSALKAPTLPFAATPGGAQGLVGNLQFDPEINNAIELGGKYSSGPLSLNVALFRQQFDSFQLNTFNGTVFLVQNINGCSTDLAGADRDLSAATGSCAAKNVTYGVSSTGVEIEAALRPARDVNVSLGFTYANTKYRGDLVGNDRGVPLDPALRVLPGNNLSNAPEVVVTGSASWTPEIGSSGLRGLVYVDARLTGDYNTGSDLFPQKAEEGYTVVNARVGLRGPREIWAVEFWAQNVFNTNYAQVAFNSPFQAGATSAPFVDPAFPGNRQLFSAFLAEPRTYGLTLRTRF